MSHASSRNNPIIDMGRLLLRYVSILISVFIDLFLGFAPAIVFFTFVYSLFSGVIAAAGEILGYGLSVEDLSLVYVNSITSPEMVLYLVLASFFWAAGVAWIAKPAGWTGDLGSIDQSYSLQERIGHYVEALVYSHHTALSVVFAALFARWVSMMANSGLIGWGSPFIQMSAPLLAAIIIYWEIYETGTAEETTTDLRKLGALLSLGWLVLLLPAILLEHFIENAKPTAIISFLLDSVSEIVSDEPNTGRTLGSEFSRFVGDRINDSR